MNKILVIMYGINMENVCACVKFSILFTLVSVCLQVQGLPVTEFENNRTDQEINEITHVDSHKHHFSLATELKESYEVRIKGQIMSKKEWLSFSLLTGYKDSRSPDMKNVACQLKVNFRKNKTTLHVVKEGNADMIDEGLPATEIISGLEFNIVFQVLDEGKSIGLFIDTLPTDNNCILKHDVNEITHVTVGGDVEKVSEITFMLENKYSKANETR